MSKIGAKYNTGPLSAKKQQGILSANVIALQTAITKGERKFYNAAVKDLSSIIIDCEDLDENSSKSNLLHDAKVNQLLTEAHKFRGRSYMRLNQPEKALADFTAAINYQQTYVTTYDPPLTKKGYPSPNYQSAHEERRDCYTLLGRSTDADADILLINDLMLGRSYAPQLADFTPNWFSASEIDDALQSTRTPSPEPQPQPRSPRSTADDMQDVAPASPGFAASLSPTNRLQDILQQGSAPRSPSPDFLKSPSPGIQR